MKSKEQLIKELEEQIASVRVNFGLYTALSIDDAEALLKLLQGEKRWISVDEALPTEQWQECWVWGEGFTEPDRDEWYGDRGEPRRWANGPDKDKDFTASGWYANTGNNITHWMPIDNKRPQPPQE